MQRSQQYKVIEDDSQEQKSMTEIIEPQRSQGCPLKTGVTSACNPTVPLFWLACILRRVSSCVVSSLKWIKCEHVHGRWTKHGQAQVVRHHIRIIFRTTSHHGYSLRIFTEAGVRLIRPREKESATRLVLQAIHWITTMEVWQAHLHGASQASYP